MFGSHLSVAGALANALREAERLTFDTVQVFTKNQRQWAFKPLEDGPRDEWLTELKRMGWLGRAVSHNSYLINLASPDDELWEKSAVTQREEIERCERLSIPFLVSHPGAHTGSGEDAGLGRIAKAYARLLKETRGYATVVCIENTVGGGSNLGGPFEHLARLRQMISEKDPEGEKRIGFCFDTCHAFAQGYDLRTADAAKATLAEFDRVCGKGTLRVMHINDSKGDLASHKDRHEHIGHGRIGRGADGQETLGGFAAIVNHPALRGVPKILETPKEKNEAGEDWDAVNLRLLRGLGGAEAAPATPKGAAKRDRPAETKPPRSGKARSSR